MKGEDCISCYAEAKSSETCGQDAKFLTRQMKVDARINRNQGKKKKKGT